MKVGVCLKQVPATDTRIKIAGPDAGIDTADIKWETNPYDEFALEAALQLLDNKQATEVIVFTVGGPDTEGHIRDALARGATAAIRLDDPSFANPDSLTVARALAAAARGAGVELLLCGKQAIDGDNAQVPAMTAELLGWPQVLVVDQLEIWDKSVKAWRQAGGGSRDVVATRLPAVISTDKGLNTPRYASLKGIMMSKKKPIDVKNAAALGLSASAPVVRTSNWGLPPARPAGRVLSGDAAAAAAELVRLLRDEAKVL